MKRRRLLCAVTVARSLKDRKPKNIGHLYFLLISVVGVERKI